MTILGRTKAVLLWLLLMKCLSIISVISKSAMTPSRIGLTATMLPGVLPSIPFASLPMAMTFPFSFSIATTDGSHNMMPSPFA